jgi:OmpA-OmpF porin, OOP family
VNRPKTIASAALLLAASAAATAADDSYFSLGVAYVAPDSGRAADYGLGGSAGYGYWLGGRLAIEGRLFATAFEAKSAADGTYGQQGLGLDLVVALGDRERSHLYVLAGGGGAYNDVTPDTLDGGSGYANAGVGWRSAAVPDRATRWRVEGRAVSDGFNGGQLDALLGFVVDFGPRPPAVAATHPPPRQIVQIVRPPAPEPVPDADGDGVPDPDDQCPETLRGAKVQPDGCVWEEQVITMSNLRFPVSSEKLTEDIRTRLDEVARFFLNQPDVVMDVYGHTDAQGSEAFNLKLSKARAASVRTYLVGKGIAPDRLKSDGFGESKPIADNATEEGRATNRRVDLHIHARLPKDE